MSALRTPLFDRHVALGARIVDFAGWEMPLQYGSGIVEEHLGTRRTAGLFDVSHMGRFEVRGPGSAAFLDECLTNDAQSLETGRAQYTLLPTPTGGALDDAFLYGLGKEHYFLVVNASNRERDLARLREALPRHPGVSLGDRTGELAMLSVQGPRSHQVLAAALGAPLPPEAASSGRNTIWGPEICGQHIWAARTGYAGEPLGFELLVAADRAGELWDRLIRAGALPVGLGARDTLRLEAGLPLYGHELGEDAEGREIPVFACPQARLGVSPAAHKEHLPGRDALGRQREAWKALRAGDLRGAAFLPRVVRQLTLLEPGVVRGGARIVDAVSDRSLGWVTSGTVVPAWLFEGEGQRARITERTERRSAALGLVDSTVRGGSEVRVEVRGKLLRALLVDRLLDSRSPPFARPVAAGR